MYTVTVFYSYCGKLHHNVFAFLRNGGCYSRMRTKCPLLTIKCFNDKFRCGFMLNYANLCNLRKYFIIIGITAALLNT